MSHIYAMHGSIEQTDKGRMTHRSLSDQKTLSRYLLKRSSSFVHWKDALRGKGNALTVDDATRASANAALLAREHGHAVTLFVNPSYIEQQTSHYFCILSSILERAEARTVRWNDALYHLANYDGRLELRRQVKRQLRGLKDENARLRVLESLRDCIGAPDLEVPDYLKTIPVKDLLALRDAGVDIQNHGWTHGEIAALAIAEQVEEIVRGREWLKSRIGVEADAYAVPFGETVPSDELSERLNIFFFCADDQLPMGTIKERTINRVNITFRPFVLSNSTTKLESH
jgi:peptidoglycan/xylan/chitin deacetylase (PgdA/CDA1 family)